MLRRCQQSTARGVCQGPQGAGDPLLVGHQILKPYSAPVAIPTGGGRPAAPARRCRAAPMVGLAGMGLWGRPLPVSDGDADR